MASSAANSRHGNGKILLLHGSRQTGDLLLGRMDKLRKKLEKQNMEIVAPTAPFQHPEDPNMRQWWNRHGHTYEGLLEETFPDLLSLWNETKESRESSFVGVIGFSQGARLAHLCCLAHAAQPQELFSGMQFVMLVAGYDAPLPTGFKEVYLSGQNVVDCSLDGFIRIPSLHVYGASDKLISPEQSQSLLRYYINPQTHEHESGHHVPMRAASVRIYEDFFIESSRRGGGGIDRKATVPVNSRNMEKTAPTPLPDDETIQLQRDEVEALAAIFPEEFHQLSNISENQADVCEHPIRYKIDLVPSDEGIWPPHPIAIEVQYPHDYPQYSLPIFKLIHENNMMELTSQQSEALLKIMKDAAQSEEGMPSVMSCVYAARDFFESGAMANSCKAAQSENSVEESKSSDQLSNEEQSSDLPQAIGLLSPSSRERIETLNLQGLEIASSVLNQMGRSAMVHSDTSSGIDDAIYGKGGHKTITIGLVGKPSAGKSTFFNTATAFARQRDDGENILGGATMAPHPFTTIDPNVGYCLVPAPEGSCPEDELLRDGIDATLKTFRSVGSTHGRDHKGRRFLPVLLKDVAGLVPGAYQGRGRGNKFLNDLTDADVLIHVLDASGTADVEGNSIGLDDDGGASPEASNPMTDMAWIRIELIEWVFSNLMFKWDTIKRRGRSKLADMFGGYGQPQAVTSSVLHAVEKYMENMEGRERALDHLSSWDEADVHRLVSAFLGVRFPMALALNKFDLPTSSRNVANILAAIPIHGAQAATPLSSRSEMNFVRYHIEQALGIARTANHKDESEERTFPSGVWNCLQSALQLQEPVIVFPVADLVSYHSLPGLFKYSTSDPSLPSAGMIRCLESAGGVAPSYWKHETLSYQKSPTNLKSNGSVSILSECLTMKPGSTVEDVFLTLKRLGALGGEFVRAEATGSIGGASRPVQKYQKVNRSNCILKIMTNKRSPWQKQK